MHSISSGAVAESYPRSPWCTCSGTFQPLWPGRLRCSCRGWADKGCCRTRPLRCRKDCPRRSPAGSAPGCWRPADECSPPDLCPPQSSPSHWTTQGHISVNITHKNPLGGLKPAVWTFCSQMWTTYLQDGHSSSDVKYDCSNEANKYWWWQTQYYSILLQRMEYLQKQGNREYWLSCIQVT